MSASEISWLTDDYNAKDAADDAAGGDFDPVPDGDYEFEVISAEEKEIDNDKGKGLRVSLQLAIRGEKYENRRLWDSFNVVYKSKLNGNEAKDKAEKTQRIGRGQFGAFCVALGISKRPGSYDELVGKFGIASVGHEEWKGKKKNRVKGYKESKQFANASRPKSTGTSGSSGAKSSPWS